VSAVNEYVIVNTALPCWLASSRWIASATIDVHRQYRPTLTLAYLPHLDYDLQKLGPDDPRIGQAVSEIDAQVGRLADYFDEQGVRVLVVSEYGIVPVRGAVLVNRVLRTEGALRIRQEQGLELLEPGASEAFAVCDHQVAHLYVRDLQNVERFARLCRDIDGVEQVLDRQAQAASGLDHERSGELVLVAERDKWFAYDYCLDDNKAPDFARTIDIHRKPGFDPRELYIDPAIRFPKWTLARQFVRSKVLNMRTLFNFVPLDNSLVRGSHGRVDLPEDNQPVLIVPGEGESCEALPCQAVRDVILSSLFSERIDLP
jgi:hypothetical protein